MRHALSSIWTLVTVALCAAVCGDALTEWLSNSGFWGSGVSDLHQESLAPTAYAAAVACLTCLALVIAAARRGEMVRVRPACASRVWWNGAAVLLALIVVVVMEGYEVRFGGIGAFDPRSVLMAHASPRKHVPSGSRLRGSGRPSRRSSRGVRNGSVGSGNNSTRRSGGSFGVDDGNDRRDRSLDQRIADPGCRSVGSFKCWTVRGAY